MSYIDLSTILIFGLFGITVVVLAYGAYLGRENVLLKKKIENLEKELTELDEQAKLMITSDL